MTVQLIPFRRPVPNVLMRHGAQAAPKARKAPKKETMVATKKKPAAAAPQFKVTNSEKITSLPAPLQAIWELLAKMDPKGELFVNDVGIISLEGDGPKDRRPQALGLSKPELEIVRHFSILDAAEADDPETATGVIFTTYQLLQAAFEAGREYEQAHVTSAVTSAAVVDDEDVDEDEDFDDEEEDSIEGEADDDEDEDLEDEDEEDDFDDE